MDSRSRHPKNPNSAALPADLTSTSAVCGENEFYVDVFNTYAIWYGSDRGTRGQAMLRKCALNYCCSTVESNEKSTALLTPYVLVSSYPHRKEYEKDI